MQPALACEAIYTAKRLQINYGGSSRVVEVHVVGQGRAGDWFMRVWQVRGGSESRENVGWKLMRLDEIASAFLIDEKSEAPRPSYNRADSAMARGIKCCV